MKPSPLYLINQAASLPQVLSETLSYIAPTATILLYQDAVVMACQNRFKTLLAPYEIKVLTADLVARGLNENLVIDASPIDYHEFVTLTLSHSSVQAR